MTARRWSLLLAAAATVTVPRATPGPHAPDVPGPAVVVLAGGCYWGVEWVFRHVRGVASAVSGYATPQTATGAAAEPVEAVRLTYDSREISLRRLLDVFFAVAHDPTQLDRQGPDVGPEYRSVVFVSNERQRSVVRAYIDSLGAAHVFARPIATQIAALESFAPAEASQQDYAARHRTDPYVVVNDVPKIEALRARFPRLYR